MSAGKEPKDAEIKDAIELLERSYEELTSLEVDVEDPVFQGSSKRAIEMTTQVFLNLEDLKNFTLPLTSAHSFVTSNAPCKLCVYIEDA